MKEILKDFFGFLALVVALCFGGTMLSTGLTDLKVEGDFWYGLKRIPPLFPVFFFLSIVPAIWYVKFLVKRLRLFIQILRQGIQTFRKNKFLTK